MRTPVLFSFIIISFFWQSQVRMSQNCQSDLMEIDKELLDHKEIVPNACFLKYPLTKIEGVLYVNLLMKTKDSFEENDLTQYNAIISARSGSIISVKWPVDKIEFLWEINGVEIVQLAHKIKPDLNKALYDTRVDSVHAGIGLNTPFTGKDVIIGVTDWGFDYTSPMFYDTLLQSTRILAAWDQFKTSGPHPTGFSYGTEYSTMADLIAAGSDTANIYSYSTHGTHVAGIAGGSGAGTPYRGIAFESQFLMTTFLADEGAVMDAWEWMYNKSVSEGKRLVVNMSWGLYHTGALDGTSLLSQALDNYTELGVVFVTSAGNNGDENFHIKYDFANDTMKTRVNFYNGSVANLWGQSIHGWGDPGQSFDFRIRVFSSTNQLLEESSWYSTSTTTNYIDTFIIAGADTIYYNLSADAAYPTNNRPQIRLRIKKVGSNNRIVFESTSTTGTVHFWNVTELTTDVGNWGMPFGSLGADYTSGDALYSIGAPACTETAISVAAHASEYVGLSGFLFGGVRANFSSIGPLITGDLKPDISAPGFGMASSISSYTDASYSQLTTVNFNGRTYPFAKLSGTSMSSPAVAGIAALLLEANPDLSAIQVKQILTQTARLDDETGPIGPTGDHYWGHGKVNAYKAIKRALNTVGYTDVQKTLTWIIFPNPAKDVFEIKGLSNDALIVQILNLSGQIIGEFENTNVIATNNYSPGFYIVRIKNGTFTEQKTLIIQ